MTYYIRTLPPLWVNNVRFFDINTFNCELYIQLTKPNTDNTNDNTLIFLLTQGEKLIGHGFFLRDDSTYLSSEAFLIPNASMNDIKHIGLST